MIKNVGNVRTCVGYTPSAAGFNVEKDDVLPPNVKDDIVVKFDAKSSGTYRADITIARIDCQGVNAPICVTPPKLSVTGTR